MRGLAASLAFFLVAVSIIPGRARAGDVASKAKDDAVAGIDRLSQELVGLADRVWSYAETALRETKSAAALADSAERQGLRVDRGIAKVPTAFVASFGAGRPIIGLLGEYDALP